ncbi:energy transducer TonB [Hymenobacter caeli]|uniref:Protein TonB n=1 Tax=Hymenobacter caeli TaxID=2735894 RepID=A0ABX2FNJ7_9BACT|nr:energy transducer TonB [Hymenobacter caeli]NRT18532.1 protein TonB [Hymenobacter caeli]
MMTNAQLATASLDDIVFDGRNQTYGAYLLRQLYQRHLLRALIIALSLLALVVSGQALARYLAGPVVAVHYVPTGPINPVLPPEIIDPIVEPPVKPMPTQPKTPAINSIKLNNFKIVPKDAAADDVPEQDALIGKHIASVTVTDGIDAPNVDDLKPTVNDAATTETVGSKPYVYVEQMPELPGGGGQAAIVAAIQRAVHYPMQAQANGVEGKVYASFVVNAQGEVTDLKIVKGVGSGLDEETLRAIAKLPRFIPGKQNGRAVSVIYTVPISFKIDN